MKKYLKRFLIVLFLLVFVFLVLPFFAAPWACRIGVTSSVLAAWLR
jgi:hypothetical protein